MRARRKRHSKGKIYSLKTFISRTFLLTLVVRYVLLSNFSLNLTNDKHAFRWFDVRPFFPKSPTNVKQNVETPKNPEESQSQVIQGQKTGATIQKGGSYDSYFKRKYIKYKKKYLILKNN